MDNINEPNQGPTGDADNSSQVAQIEVRDYAPIDPAGSSHLPSRIDEIRAEGSQARNASNRRARDQSISSRISRSIFRGRHSAQDGLTPGEIRRSATRSREENYRRRLASASPGGSTRTGRFTLNAPSLSEMPHHLRDIDFQGPACELPSAAVPDHLLGLDVQGPVCAMPSFHSRGPRPIQQQEYYIAPGYAELNPEYVQPKNERPVWSLANPLPRVVRPAMVPWAHDGHGKTKPVKRSQRDIDLEAGAASEKPKPKTKLEEIRDKRECAFLHKQHDALHDAHDDGHTHDHVTTHVTAMDARVGRRAHENDRPPSLHSGAAEDIGLAHPFGESHRHDDALHDHDPHHHDDTRSVMADGQVLMHDGVEYAPLDSHNHHTRWAVIRTKYREPLAELLATTVQLTIGFCADLGVTVTNMGSEGGDVGAISAWAWGLATMIGIYIAGGISGAHLNPAISIMLWIYRGFPVRKIPIYVLAQLVGAFLAGLIAFGLYRRSIIEYGGSDLAAGNTAADFITFPRHAWVNVPTAFFNEFVGSACLAIAVMAMGDDSNAPPGAGMNAFVLGLVVVALSMAFGYNTGAALNPSRDFGPRLALLALGYGTGLFRNGYWAYGPWAGATLGALFGAGLYDIMIFVGGESPINYPACRVKRATTLWKGRMNERIRKVPKKLGIRKRPARSVTEKSGR